MATPACGGATAYLVMVVVSVAVPPGPVLFLFFGGKLAKITVRIAVVLPGPGVVVRNLVIVPDVVIAVIGIIDPVVMVMGATRTHN